MQDNIYWYFDTARRLTSSLREFIDFSPNIESQEIDNGLEHSRIYFRENNDYQNEYLKKLSKAWEENNWIISWKDEKLIRMGVQDKLLCARDEILIIKGCPERNISAIAKERFSSYFLVAALSCNGNSLIYWKDGAWKYDFEKAYIGNELYYFYYCKMNPRRIHKYLRFEYYPTTYQENYKVLESIWNYNRSHENTSNYQLCYNVSPNRGTIDEETKISFASENNEFVEKLKKENEKNKLIIESLKAKIAELEGKLTNHENCQDQINKLKNNNELLKIEIQQLKSSSQSQANILNNMYDKERNEMKEIHNPNIETIEQLKLDLDSREAEINKLVGALSVLNAAFSQRYTELDEAKEKNKQLEEKLKDLEEVNKTNYSQIIYNPENEIIKLVPNRKHGLPNFGNTCYLNSLLQIFASTPLFARKVESINSPFCNSLSLLLDGMIKDNSLKAISNLMQNFRQNLIAIYPNIEACTQQDVKEVFNMILSKIEEDGGNLDLFSIGLHQEFTCNSKYKHKSQYHDIQTFLIIPSQHKGSAMNYLWNLSSYYNSKQKLFCRDCNKEVDTNIQLRKVDWPTYLILYFPTPPNNITENIYLHSQHYEMYGAICYYQDEGCFHYTAFTKDENDWNEYNDEHFDTKIIDSRVVNLAFYSKKP